jgi:hypothetical protein
VSQRARLVAAGGALALQMLVLYAPSAPDVGDSALPLDKVVHAAVFALATYALAAAGVSLGWVVGLMSAHAVVSELVQHRVLADRAGEPADVAADLVGVAIGVLLVRIRRRPRRASPRWDDRSRRGARS